MLKCLLGMKLDPVQMAAVTWVLIYPHNRFLSEVLLEANICYNVLWLELYNSLISDIYNGSFLWSAHTKCWYRSMLWDYTLTFLLGWFEIVLNMYRCKNLCIVSRLQCLLHRKAGVKIIMLMLWIHFCGCHYKDQVE